MVNRIRNFFHKHIQIANNTVCGIFMVAAFTCALGSWFGAGDMNLIIPVLLLGWILACVGWWYAPDISKRGRILWIIFSASGFASEAAFLRYHFYRPQITDTNAQVTPIQKSSDAQRAKLIYQNDDNFIIRFGIGTESDRYVVFMEIQSDAIVLDAVPYLTDIRQISDSKDSHSVSKPFRSWQRMQLGWYDMKHAFDPRTISGHDRFAPFNIFLKEKRLAFYTNTGAAELDKFYENVPIGTYRMTIEVIGPHLTDPIRQDYILNWNGTSDSFSMKAVDN